MNDKETQEESQRECEILQSIIPTDIQYGRSREMRNNTSLRLGPECVCVCVCVCVLAILLEQVDVFVFMFV